MLKLPPAAAVTIPPAATVATLGLDELHVAVRSGPCGTAAIDADRRHLLLLTDGQRRARPRDLNAGQRRRIAARVGDWPFRRRIRRT